MHASTEIVIAAEPHEIFELARATERWPHYLPHYRWVRVLARSGPTTTLAMAARRDWIPVSWVAEQTDDAERPAIRFLHVRGWTRGMEVEWRFEPVESGTRVTIEHRLEFRFPVAAQWLGEHLIGKFFVDSIARKTLQRMKILAEGGA